jgi:hypothetical protein
MIPVAVSSTGNSMYETRHFGCCQLLARVSAVGKCLLAEAEPYIGFLHTEILDGATGETCLKGKLIQIRDCLKFRDMLSHITKRASCDEK